MFEHRRQPLLSWAKYRRRIAGSLSAAAAILAVSLGMGVAGYRFIEGLPWIDALLNAAMILGGMGPVNELHTSGGKLFAACYALFSGIVFITVSAIVLAPVLHRFLHKFHLESESHEKR
jgi:hypothetical protein